MLRNKLFMKIIMTIFQANESDSDAAEKEKAKPAVAEKAPTAPNDALFNFGTRAIVWGLQTRAVQGMLDFDYVCRRPEPSARARGHLALAEEVALGQERLCGRHERRVGKLGEQGARLVGRDALVVLDQREEVCEVERAREIHGLREEAGMAEGGGDVAGVPLAPTPRAARRARAR